MNIFYEVYGTYFRTVEKILSRESLNDSEISRIISEEAFRDSLLFIPPKLIPREDNRSDWELLKKISDGSYSRITRKSPPKFITELQKRWLKAKLSDPKMRLFLSDDTLFRLEKRLENVKPLYDPDMFRYFDVFSDGDDFSDHVYRSNFKVVLDAVKSKKVLDIEFISGKNNRIHGNFLPIKLEYSRKNDKFRIYCFHLKNGSISGNGIINMGRIISARISKIEYKRSVDPERYFSERKCNNPVKIEVGGERNGIERFMMEFASFEKRTERDLTTGKCIVWLWYDRQNETELLIRLLGYGPVIKILGPEDFRRQAAGRVRRQYELIFGR